MDILSEINNLVDQVPSTSEVQPEKFSKLQELDEEKAKMAALIEELNSSRAVKKPKITPPKPKPVLTESKVTLPGKET